MGIFLLDGAPEKLANLDAPCRLETMSQELTETLPTEVLLNVSFIKLQKILLYSLYKTMYINMVWFSKLVAAEVVK